jgi:hypothetical protein
MQPLELLRDPVLAGNLLGSFLGKDQAETVAPYLSAEVAPSIASSTLPGIVEISIQNPERVHTNLVTGRTLRGLRKDFQSIRI